MTKEQKQTWDLEKFYSQIFVFALDVIQKGIKF